MFECCPEKQLKTLFPIFENVVLGKNNRKRSQFSPNEKHFCTKLCRTIMTKLTLTHDLQFRGTLQRFLAKSLPLTHRSGKQALWHAQRTRQAATRRKSENLCPATQPCIRCHAITPLNSTNWCRLQRHRQVQHSQHNKHWNTAWIKATIRTARPYPNNQGSEATFTRCGKHRDERGRKAEGNTSRLQAV